ncbi:hypothetical protein [Maribellus maritimus]|uniref:hypothetical protein n=1 Tax=Maribellus maritimus TaxID=2870838 RepID=UPI001EEBDDBF|nr:hypothetical protein [Maribellus maritimus]MCG6186424.1 hypothetical protein [Maribellus maritimus]
MEKFKKIVLYAAGPGVVVVEVVAIFVHLFTSENAKPWITGGLIVFFVVFIPLYSVEYFKQNFKNEKSKSVQFKKTKNRTEWEGGNIHGKVPKNSERPEKIFNK